MFPLVGGPERPIEPNLEDPRQRQPVTFMQSNEELNVLFSYWYLRVFVFETSDLHRHWPSCYLLWTSSQANTSRSELVFPHPNCFYLTDFHSSEQPCFTTRWLKPKIKKLSWIPLLFFTSLTHLDEPWSDGS